MKLLSKIFSNTCKPQGFWGRMILNGMNGADHARLADWGISHLDGYTPTKIIEIGCGGGRNAKELLRLFPGATMTAVDYSEESVKKTKQTARAEIGAGRCTVQQADVSALPFEADSFDLATAFETIYFWPGLEKCFAQVAKVLKTGGRFLIANESTGHDKTSEKWASIVNGMSLHDADEITTALKAAGFSLATADVDEKKNHLCVLAVK